MSNFSEEDRKFIHEFMDRTLKIVKEYKGSHDATLLLNCLLGLLVVPKERMIEEIPTDPLDTLKKWGIDPRMIKHRKCECGGQYPTNLRQLVKCMRNAVAHFNIHWSSPERAYTLKG